MPALTHEFAPISVRLPGANAVMSDIPVGLFTSPPSLDVDHEQLTVRLHSSAFRPLANLSSLESESLITLMRASPSPYVRSRRAPLLLALTPPSIGSSSKS